ncbi:MAG: hypothetical protein AAF919_13735 [Pseudomonadota bacterium]
MPLTDPFLWARLDGYRLPSDSQGRSFEEQLRAAHGISATTAARAVTEYKRFLYLCATGHGRSVPTKAVDEVWHLHLSHSEDYWERFVPQILDGKAIHHSPGEPEGHAKDFKATVARYEAEFGETPPKGIWKGPAPSMIAALLFALPGAAFAGLWLASAPFPVSLFGLFFGAAWIFATLGPTVQATTGWHLGVSVDIWSDSEGGDCGSCGGGCGD